MKMGPAQFDYRRAEAIRKNHELYEQFVPDQKKLENFDRRQIPNPKAFRAALRWRKSDLDNNKLFLFGKPQRGKTFALSALLWKVTRCGEAVQAWTWSELKKKVARIATCEEKWRFDEMEELSDNLKDADWLFLDDVFQGPASPSFFEFMRDVLEHFEGLLVVTSNYSPPHLKRKFARGLGNGKSWVSPELASAVLQRIVKVGCDFVNFDAGMPPE